jgi:hypothetical protein
MTTVKDEPGNRPKAIGYVRMGTPKQGPDGY